MGDNEDETTGMKIVSRALEEPLRQIVENAGLEGLVVVAKVKEGKKDYGFNAKADEYQNMYEAGIIDPTKVSPGCSRKCQLCCRHVVNHRSDHHQDT